jgi:hypothetical protein
MNNDPLKQLRRQIERLRILRPLPVDRAAVVAHARTELNELLAEVQCSKEAQGEAADILAIAVHLCLIEGLDIDKAIVQQANKLRLRLELVLRGQTWEEAKRTIATHGRSMLLDQVTVPAQDLGVGDRFEWTGSFGTYEVLACLPRDPEDPERIILECLSHTRNVVVTRLPNDTPCRVTMYSGVISSMVLASENTPTPSEEA